MNCLRRHMCWQSKRFYREMAPECRVRESRRTALSHSLQPQAFMVMGLVSGLSLAIHSDSESFLVVLALVSQDGCQWEGLWEVVIHVSFWPFPNSSGWWWLISCMFLTRTSFYKTTHANGYYSAWLGVGGVASVSMLPLTVPTHFFC